MRRFIPIGAFAVLALLVGCQTSAEHQGAITPTVSFRGHKSIFGGGLTFTSTKDDTIEIGEASYNAKTGEFTLKGFKVRQDSPAVIGANVAQMAALVPLREQEIRFQAQVGQNIAACLATINQGIAMGGEAGAKVIAAGITALNGLSGSITTPVGGGAFEFRSPPGTTPQIPVKVTPPPTGSQPGANEDESASYYGPEWEKAVRQSVAAERRIEAIRARAWARMSTLTRATATDDEAPIWLTPHDTGCDQSHVTTCTVGRMTVVPDPGAAPVENPEM